MIKKTILSTLTVLALVASPRLYTMQPMEKMKDIWKEPLRLLEIRKLNKQVKDLEKKASILINSIKKILMGFLSRKITGNNKKFIIKIHL